MIKNSPVLIHSTSNIGSLVVTPHNNTTLLHVLSFYEVQDHFYAWTSSHKSHNKISFLHGPPFCALHNDICQRILFCRDHRRICNVQHDMLRCVLSDCLYAWMFSDTDGSSLVLHPINRKQISMSNVCTFQVYIHFSRSGRKCYIFDNNKTKQNKQ